ncbi:MAG: potassium/proton antiporter, partial [Candidatus Nanopelagicales bacterium]
LRLPQSATLTLVVRSGHSVMPEHSFRLRADDQLLIVVAGGMREAVEARLLAIHDSGRLAGWVTTSSDGAPVGWVTRFRRVLR